MSNEASRLLRETESEEKTIECIECGKDCPVSADVCPHCGLIPKTFLLREYGAKLPIGILETTGTPDKKKEVLKKDFSVRKIDWNVEREIADHWKKLIKQSDTTVIDHVACVLANTVNAIGGTSISKFDPDRRYTIIRNMFAGDVFYMYAWARIVSMGNILTVKNMKCFKCNHEFDYPIDLETIEVAARNDPKQLYQTLELEDGILIGGELRKKFTLRPATFTSIASSPETNEADMFRDLVKDCIVGIEGLGDGATVTDSEIATLGKPDISIISEQIDIIGAGPEWDIECVCPKCKFEFDHSIDWRYTDFFSRSSRSKRRRKRSRS